MLETKDTKRRILRILILLAIGWSIQGGILLFLGDMVGKPAHAHAWIYFEPSYNTHGNWFNQIFGTEYDRIRMLLQHSLSLALLLLLYRVLDYTCRYFHIERIWLKCYDFGLAAFISRLAVTAAGKYTLDYLGIGLRVYDFFDICIGIAMAGTIIWYIRYVMKYYPYKKSCVEGMAFRERFLWERKFGLQIFRAIWLPREKWEGGGE